MQTQSLPTLLETALGGMLQDIGKFMQRAYGSVQRMDPAVRQRESVILSVYQGRYSHKHALWTEAFFQWMENEGLSFPRGVNLHRVRDMAVFHHKPESFGTLGWLAAEADRLSSGMDRKPRDENLEEEAEQSRGWDGFIKTPLLSPFCQLDLGLGTALRRYQPLAALLPGDDLLPVEKLDTSDYPNRYRQLWEGFTAEFRALCRLDNLALFCEGLLSLSERYTFAIPSSTMDLPDISLHDYSRTVAAIAACLYAWHARQGTLNDEAAIRDRSRPKFRFLAGDLSGIQHTLFILANQQVKGVNKILRARSFLIGLLMEAAVLRCREALGLAVFNLIQNAGGRFVLLVADLPETGAAVETLRTEIDSWMRERYLGELVINLALSEPFAGGDLMPQRFPAVQKNLARAIDQAKLRALQGRSGVLALDYSEDECSACGVRPARYRDGDTRRCDVCHDEHRLGGWLPRTVALSWQAGKARGGEREIDFFGGLCLRLYGKDEDHSVGGAGLLSATRLYRSELNPPCPPLAKGGDREEAVAKGGDREEALVRERASGDFPGWAFRFAANYVPTLEEGEADKPGYADLDQDERISEAGDIKTFAMLARDALEEYHGEFVGKPLLAVLKADVDRLGLLFGFGLSDSPDQGRDRATLSRFAALSRLMDLFFTGYLQELIRRAYPDTYTVYAGGDDLLLIGPWRQTVQLAGDLNHRFRLYTGENPNISLSAGLALIKANQPLNRSAREAGERLERAKEAGRDRICLIDERPVSWDRLSDSLKEAETLSGWLREELVSTAAVHKLLYFAEQRFRAEQDMELACADWRARWGYHLARNVRGRLSDTLGGEVMNQFNQLLGLDRNIQNKAGEWQPSQVRIPVSIALYRNRS